MIPKLLIAFSVALIVLAGVGLVAALGRGAYVLAGANLVIVAANVGLIEWNRRTLATMRRTARTLEMLRGFDVRRPN